MTPKHTKSAENEQKEQPKRLRKFQRDYEILDEKTEDEKKRETEKSTGNSSEKKFSEMNLIEKVDYFLNRSEQAPKLRSEIITSEQTYRGIITDYKDDHVLIRLGRRASSTEIPMNQVEEINLLGF